MLGLEVGMHSPGSAPTQLFCIVQSGLCCDCVELWGTETAGPIFTLGYVLWEGEDANVRERAAQLNLQGVSGV